MQFEHDARPIEGVPALTIRLLRSVTRSKNSAAEYPPVSIPIPQHPSLAAPTSCLTVLPSIKRSCFCPCTTNGTPVQTPFFWLERKISLPTTRMFFAGYGPLWSEALDR